MSSASNVSSDETGVRPDHFVPGFSNCRGVQGQRRQHQPRGQRRGGRSRHQHWRAAPVAEHLDKLSLSSDCTEGPVKTKAQGNRGQHMQGNPELCQSKTGGEVCATQQDSSGDQSTSQSGLETESPKDAADSVGCRSHRGRRRGPHRPGPHTGAPGPARYHWDGRASRNRGGGNHLCSRGGGSRQGHGRDFQQKVVDSGREEVL